MRVFIRSTATLLLGLLVFFIPTNSLAVPGDLDPTFGKAGRLIDGVPVHSRDDAYGVAIQPDGKIVVAGTSEYFPGTIARYNPDGSLDAAFGNDGWIVGCQARDVVIQANGKILVGCSARTGANWDFAIARYNSDGSPDRFFGNGGFVSTPISAFDDYLHSIAVDPYGRIVAAGTFYSAFPNGGIAMARFNADGSPDLSFDGDGKLTTIVGGQRSEANSVAIQSDGKIVVAGEAFLGSQGYSFILIRYNLNGSLDTSFDSDGIASAGFGDGSSGASAVAIQADGKIVAAGHSSSRFALMRFHVNGSLDTTFDGDGKVITALSSGTGILPDGATSVAIRPDGKIVAAGYSYVATGLTDTDLAIARYNANGSLDTTFNGDGRVTTPVNQGVSYINAVANQPDGRIVGVGHTSPWFDGGGGSSTERDNFVVARYNDNGSLDPTFDADGIVITDFTYRSGTLNDVTIQTDGKIVAIGTHLVRYNPDGTRDATFGGGTGMANFRGNVVRLQADGKLLIASGYSCTGDDDSLVATITRVDQNGSLDTSFGKGGTAELGCKDGAAGYTWFNALAVQPDGKIVAAGGRYAPGGPDFVLARYNIDGSLDTTFGLDGAVITEIGTAGAEAVAIQSDGKIVAAGGRYNASFSLARYNPDGSLDTTFDGDGKVTTPIGAASNATSVAIQADGRIVAAGISTTGSNTDIAVVRYNSNGSLDATFDSDGIVTTAVDTNSAIRSSLALDRDGKLLVAASIGGDFALIRYNPNGSLDTSLNGNGIAKVDFDFSYDIAYGMALDAEGRAVVVGRAGGSFALARLLITAPRLSVSGRVMSATGAPIRNAVVTITDPFGATRSTITSTFGSYSFDDVAAGQTYTLRASAKRFRFDPKSLAIADNISDLDIIANPSD